MTPWMLSIAERLRPALRQMRGVERELAAIRPVQVLASVPIIVAGLVWLVLNSDLTFMLNNWPLGLLVLVFTAAFKAFDFQIVNEFNEGMYATSTSDAETLVTWSALLLFGPEVLWITMLVNIASPVLNMWGAVNTEDERWQVAGNIVQQAAADLLQGSIIIVSFTALGGSIPLSGFTLSALLPAFGAALLAMMGILVLLMVTVLLYVNIMRRHLGGINRAPLIGAGQVIGISGVTGLFAVPIASLYTEVGPVLYFVFLGSLLGAAYIAHRLSAVLERNRQRSREMEQLEHLSRSLIEAAPGALEDLLAEHIPGMFSFAHLEVRTFPNRQLVKHPEMAAHFNEAVWAWLAKQSEMYIIKEGDPSPWQPGATLESSFILCPIAGVAGDEVAGGLIIRRGWRGEEIGDLRPAARSLAAQVESALRREHTYKQIIEYERSAREMEIAGRIQDSFLSVVREIPQVPGWELAITLESARETSGDFFDVIPLPNGHWGFVIADVADKGMGAALFMALSRTLIRTFAIQLAAEHPMQPELVLNKANQRILADTRSNQFVTLVYIIIDPETGRGVYANAGHNPPYLLRADGVTCEDMPRTGIPVGMMEDWTWEHRSVHIEVGDMLVMYTDGITEAQNGSRAQYDDDGRFRDLLDEQRGADPNTVRDAIVEEVKAFVGEAPQSDDITLLILKHVGLA